MLASQFKEFLSIHLGRHPRADWPSGEAATVLFGCWLAAFKARQVTPQEADEASRWLAERGGAFPDNHLGLLLGRIHERRRVRATESAAQVREELLAARVAEAARDRELADLWESLTPWDQQQYLDQVADENPGLARFPIFLRRIAMERAAACDTANGWY